jgi:hypothetical protein
LIRHILVYPNILCETMKDNNHDKECFLLFYKEYILHHLDPQSVEDLNDEECALYEIGGNILYCDCCPSSFHTECLGIQVSALIYDTS